MSENQPVAIQDTTYTFPGKRGQFRLRKGDPVPVGALVDDPGAVGGEPGELIEAFATNVGYLAEDITDPETGEVLVAAGTEIDVTPELDEHGSRLVVDAAPLVTRLVATLTRRAHETDEAKPKGTKKGDKNASGPSETVETASTITTDAPTPAGPPETV